MGRRGMLAVFGAAGVAAVAVSCGTRRPGHDASTSAPAGRPARWTGRAPPAGRPAGPRPSVDVADGEIPEETAGPYPGDGSNGVNVLTESGIVRSDLTTSFGAASGVAEGVPVTVQAQGLRPERRGRHRDGRRRGLPVALRPRGQLLDVRRRRSPTRTTCAASRRPTPRAASSSPSIFPACYAGRWPHMHFEVYQSLADATSYTNKLRTSQLALPQDVCDDVYATEGYEQSRHQPGRRQPGQRRHLLRRLLAADGRASPAPSTTATRSPSTSRCSGSSASGG